MKTPFGAANASSGLHFLKDFCNKSDLGKQSAYLADPKNLAQAIKVTEDSTQLRGEYRLDRPFMNLEEFAESQRERLWEQAVYQRWHYRRPTKLSPLKNCWSRLIGYQVPLFAARNKEGWGNIDLLGLQDNGTPVVIELKKEPKAKSTGTTENGESPLRIILEAAAYGVSLRKHWPSLHKELAGVYKDMDKSGMKVPERIQTVQLVGAAPASYWLDWLPVTMKGRSKLPDESWEAFDKLLCSLKENNLPVSFVSLSGDPSNPDSIAAQPLIGFPSFCYSRKS